TDRLGRRDVHSAQAARRTVRATGCGLAAGRLAPGDVVAGVGCRSGRGRPGLSGAARSRAVSHRPGPIMGRMPERSGSLGGAADRFLSHPIAGDAVLAVLLAVPLGAMSVGLLSASISPTWHVLAAGGGLAVLHACVVWRRRFPQAAYLFGAGAMLGLVLLPALQDPTAWQYPPVLLPSSMTFGLLLYTAGSQMRRQQAIAALLVALVGVVAVVARLWSPATWGAEEAEPLVWRIGLTLGLSAMSGCLWALGRLSGIRGKYLAQLREK